MHPFNKPKKIMAAIIRTGDESGRVESFFMARSVCATRNKEMVPKGTHALTRKVAVALESGNAVDPLRAFR